MTDRINIKGISAIGFHGVLDEERTNGQKFIVDVDISFPIANLNDNLENTIDYSEISILVKEEIEGKPVNLIETLGERIANRILLVNPKIIKVSVTVHKPHAPIPVDFSDVFITITKNR